jgi:hypothetical protein
MEKRGGKIILAASKNASKKVTLRLVLLGSHTADTLFDRACERLRSLWNSWHYILPAAAAAVTRHATSWSTGGGQLPPREGLGSLALEFAAKKEAATLAKGK